MFHIKLQASSVTPPPLTKLTKILRLGRVTLLFDHIHTAAEMHAAAAAT